ncbi:hypothetical protein ACVR1I_07585 [Streptococcus cameli]
MKLTEKKTRFWRLAIGLLLLGVGQRLLLTGGVTSWATDIGWSPILILLSFILLIVGILLIAPIGMWFYRANCSDPRLKKLVLFYLLTTVMIGLVVGGIGQLLYDYTTFTYTDVKMGIWLVSTMLQMLLKIALCYCLVSLHRQLSIRGRRSILWLPSILSIFFLSITMGLTIWIPSVGNVLVSVVDSFILIAILYYFIYLTKEKSHEKTP